MTEHVSATLPPTALRSLACFVLGASLFLAACGPQPVDEETPPPDTPTLEPGQTPTPDITPAETPTLPPTAGPTLPPTEAPTESPTPIPPPRAFKAILRTTSHGIPHVLGETLGDVSFGLAYAFARHHVCVLADQVTKVRSERARYFGRGENDEHLNSDFGFLGLGVYEHAGEALQEQSPEVAELLEGYVAGYNQYLADTDPAALPADCASAPWVKPISQQDLMAFYLAITRLASGQALVPGVAVAGPPTDAKEPETLPPPVKLGIGPLGSNGWALGGDRTASGRGAVVANPHFPWEGESRFFEAQLTVPGLLDVYGVGLLGVPIINIGFNAHVGWTHTFSYASRGTFYELELDPGDPTRYRYEEEYRQMTGRDYQVKVRYPDGSLGTVSRRLYRSHYGPIVEMEGAGWTRRAAYSFRDTNEYNPRFLEQYLRMMTATSVAEVRQAHAEIQGLPWAYTMVADDQGDALFMDSSTVPNLSEEALDAWLTALETDPLTQLAAEIGAPLLDGTLASNEWVEDPEAAQPGLVPFSQAPQLLRRDYVLNANDSHWLPNELAPLEGYSPLYGSERKPLAPRSRMNHFSLIAADPWGYAGEDGRFSQPELEAAILSNDTLMAKLLQADVARRCQGVSEVNLEGERVNIEEGCALIAAWDGQLELTSVGAAVWREFLAYFEDEDLKDAGALFAQPFDPEDPLNTPYGLARAPITGDDPILLALAYAVSTLELAGIPLDAPLGEVQFTWRGDQKVPLHGGRGEEGVCNVVHYWDKLNTTLLPRIEVSGVVDEKTNLTPEGFLDNYGTSFVMALQFTDAGPQARGLLLYSQSSDARSPYFNDQGPLFTRKELRDLLFTEEEIAGDPAFEATEVKVR